MSQAATIDELLKFAQSGRELVDTHLDAALPATQEDPLRLREAMRYAVLGGGKRMRPVLALAVCQALGAQLQAALPGACAVELVHAYSLVHDDLPAMDDDDERRGRPTVHVAFGEGAAILVGDALLTQAFSVLVQGVQGDAVQRLGESVALLGRHAGIDGMVGGQALDIAHGQDIGDIERLEKVHTLKTGALYAVAAALGAIAAGAPKATVDAMERFGMAFGIAFQHADDALDDEQPRLREQALERVRALVGVGQEILQTHKVPKSAPVWALGPWVESRATRAAKGDKDSA